jgi:hypothetical protein
MTAKNLRLVLAAVVSIYGVVSAADKMNGLHLPPAVSAVLVAAAPIMLAVQHWLSDPSTGTPSPAAPGPTPAPDPAPLPASPAPQPHLAAQQSATVVQSPGVPGATVLQLPQQPSPAPVPPPEWSTMAAAAPAAPPPPNPAPPAPGA